MDNKMIKGQATLEFALMLPVVIAFILVVSQLGHMVYVQNILEQASRESARIAATTADAQRAEQAALHITSDLKREDLALKVVPQNLESLAIGDFVRVEITYRYRGLAEVIETLTQKEVRLQSKSIMRIECENKQEMFP